MFAGHFYIVRNVKVLPRTTSSHEKIPLVFVTRHATLGIIILHEL